MKKANMTANNKLKIVTAILISMLMCFCMCACGESGNTEETVEITTPAEDTTSLLDKETGSGDTAKDENSEDSSDDADKSSSPYAKIYKDCNTKMKEAAAKYTEELEGMVSDVSKSKLYDETQSRIEELKKIYDDSKDKMVKAMLDSTDDDAKDYEKYFNKMTEAYTEYSRDLTKVYTDAF